MILSPLKSQPNGRNVREILHKSSWNTHLKHSNPYTVMLPKVKKLPEGFCTYLFFASAIILIFGGLFLHRFSRLLKANFNWLRVPTTDFARQICRTRMKNPNSSKLSWKARKKPPKSHTKNRPFFSV